MSTPTPRPVGGLMSLHFHAGRHRGRLANLDRLQLDAVRAALQALADAARTEVRFTLYDMVHGGELARVEMSFRDPLGHGGHHGR